MLKEQKLRESGKISCQQSVTKLNPGCSRKVSKWTLYWRQSNLWASRGKRVANRRSRCWA